MSAFRFLKGAYLVLFLIAVVLHVLLAVYAPDPNGYVYDFYSDAIFLTYNNGQLPSASDCWVCYHPPLLPILGTAIFYITASLGGSVETQLFSVAFVLNLISLLFAVFCYAIYLHYRANKQLDLVLWALLLFLPVCFINAFSIEADMLVATLIVISTYYFIRFLDTELLTPLMLSAVFVALSALTKYTGLVIAIYFGMVLLVRWFWGLDKNRFVHGLCYAMVVSVICAYPYINNQIKYGTPVAGNNAWNTGTDQPRRYRYNYLSFNIKRIVDVFTTEKVAKLKYFHAFNSEVLNSHYGQLWTDFSFYTRAKRHGQYERGLIYKGKYMPVWLLWAILVVGLVPVIAGMLGLPLLIFKRESMILVGMTVITLAVYVHWFTGHNYWMLKTKYLMFLLPLWLISINRFGQVIPAGILRLLIAPAAVFSLIYCFYFAVF